MLPLDSFVNRPVQPLIHQPHSLVDLTHHSSTITYIDTKLLSFFLFVIALGLHYYMPLVFMTWIGDMHLLCQGADLGYLFLIGQIFLRIRYH